MVRQRGPRTWLCQRSPQILSRQMSRPKTGEKAARVTNRNQTKAILSGEALNVLVQPEQQQQKSMLHPRPSRLQH